MTNEELFEEHKDWAELKAKKRHRKLAAILPGHLCPSEDELVNGALAGLWIGILEYKSKGKDLIYYADSKISQEFTRVRREYSRYETRRDNFEHGDSREVERIVERVGKAKR